MLDVVTGINSVLGGIKELIEIVGKLKSLNAKTEDVLAAQQSVLGLQQSMFEIKEKVFMLQDENASLKKQIENFEDFEVYRQDFELHPIAGGVYAYIGKQVEKLDNTTPWYCQPCFDNRKKAVLQFAKRQLHTDDYQCPLCGTHIAVPHGIKNLAQTARPGSRWGDY